MPTKKEPIHIKETIMKSMFSLLKFGFLLALVISLTLVIAKGISCLYPLIKTEILDETGLGTKDIFESVLSGANFSVLYISILFTLISIIIALVAIWLTRTLDKLEKCHDDYLHDLAELSKFKEETSKNIILAGQFTTAKIYCEQKKYSLAWEHIENIPSAFSYEVSLYKAKILYYKEIDKKPYDRIFKLLETALNFPNITTDGQADVYAFIGRAWLEVKNYKEALIYSKKAIEKKYILWSAHNQKAISLRHLNKLDKAIETLENVINIDNNYSYAYYNLACYYCLKITETLSYKDKVIACLKKSIELKPDDRTFAKADPDFANIKDDPEFIRLLEIK